MFLNLRMSRHIASSLWWSFSQPHRWLPVEKHSDLIGRDPTFETEVAITMSKNKPDDGPLKIQKARLAF